MQLSFFPHPTIMGADAPFPASIANRAASTVNRHDEFLELFDTCRKAHPDRFRAFATTEKNGGRYEERKCVQTDYVEWFPEVGERRGLRSVIMVEECRITLRDVASRFQMSHACEKI